MTVRVFVKPRKVANAVKQGQEEYIEVPLSALDGVNFRPEWLEHVLYVSWWEGIFLHRSTEHILPGLYMGTSEGKHWKVEILAESGSAPDSKPWFRVAGTFPDLGMLKAFEHQLRYSQMRPSILPGGNGYNDPLIERLATLQANEVGLLATLSAVTRRLEMLECQIPGFQLRKTIYEALPGQVSELEARLGQLTQHVTDLEQLQQNKIMSTA
jgi:hypothetical protein